MAHVDALSRISIFIEILFLERELELKQLQDPEIKDIAEQLEFFLILNLIQGLVYRKRSDLPRFAVSEFMVVNVIRAYHNDLAHCGKDCRWAQRALLISFSA